MKTIYYNATIVTMDERDCVLCGASLAVDGDRIVSVGGTFDAADARMVDCCGDIIMPAFVNTHTHLPMSLFRSVADDVNLSDWLTKTIFPLEAKLTDADVEAGTLLSLCELARSGTVAVIDMYMYPELVASLVHGAGFRGAVGAGDSDADGKTVERLARQRRLMDAGGVGAVKFWPSFHGEYTCSDAYLEGVMELSQEYALPVTGHCSETLEEVGGCAKRHNDLSPLQYFHAVGLLDHGGVLAHCVYCDKDDFALMAQCGVSVSVNSASNLKLASGIPPILSMLRANVNVSLGTDSAASNNRLDMFREMYLAAVLPKGHVVNPTAVTAAQAIRLATVNGWRALGVLDSGVLKVGYSADFVRLGIDGLDMTPLGHAMSSVVYCGAAAQVKTTVAAGRVLYDQGVFPTLDQERIRAKAKSAAKRLICG